MASTCNRNGSSNQPKNENANRNENRNQNQNPKALIALAIQLGDLLAKGANGNRGGGVMLRLYRASRKWNYLNSHVMLLLFPF
jgi:hypothetical protein